MKIRHTIVAAGGTVVAIATTLGCYAGGDASTSAAASDGSDNATTTHEDTGASESGSTGAEVEPLDVDVPDDGPRRSLESLCFDVATDAPRAASPEGLLWIQQAGDDWRVLDPLGAETTQSVPLTATALRPYSVDRAYAIAQEQLWSVQAGYPQPLAWPQGLAAPTAMCGDPSSDANGFVVAQGLLQRDRGQWWTWTAPGGGAFDDIDWLAEAAGACIGLEGTLWMSVGGAVWRITPQLAARVEALDGATAATFGDVLGVAAILDGKLLVGDEEIGFTRYDFAAGEVTAVAGGGPAVWALAGPTLYRLSAGDALPVAIEVDGQDVQGTGIAGDAAGNAWVFQDTRACHVRASSPLRIEGVHHLQRRDDEMLTLSIDAPAHTDITVQLDGRALELTAQPSGPWLTEPAEVPTGWHTLQVDAMLGTQAVQRTLQFEQRGLGELTWSDDIEPLFLAHCAGDACHGPDLPDDTRPDLSNYASWLDAEEGILARVVTQGDMPPYADRSEAWTLDTVLAVFEWYETGAPQEED